MSRSLPIAEAPMYVECGRRYEILVLRIDENRIVCQTRREIDILDMEQKNMIQCRATFVFGESQSQSAKSSPKERNRFRSCGLRVPTPIKLWTPDFYPPPSRGIQDAFTFRCLTWRYSHCYDHSNMDQIICYSILVEGLLKHMEDLSNVVAGSVSH